MNPLVKRYLVGLVITTAAVMALSPQPKITLTKTGASDDGWLVPKIAPDPGNAAAALSDLLQSRLWGAAPERPNLVDDKASRWRIAGITGRPAERYVIVQFGDERIVQLKAGDKFPDGTPILAVREGGVCLLLSSKRRLLPIEGQMPPITW
jgi:hypothetical protein